MPYSPGTRLPGESASKLGHLAVVKSEWVKALVGEFEQTKLSDVDSTQTVWQTFNPEGIIPLRNVWAVDGSYVSIASGGKPPKEVSFVKTALLVVDRARLDAIDKGFLGFGFHQGYSWLGSLKEFIHRRR